MNGVETRDAYNSTLFNMRAIILWTINDYLAYAMMSWWSTKGYKACPTCNEETPSVGIRSKIAYIGHRRFLDMDHEWRSKLGRKHIFELDYWKELLLRHNLDVMHIEKNVCDNVLGTLLNLEGKSKDTDKASLI